MSGGPQGDACPYCGSTEIELFPDKSGRCLRCRMSFTKTSLTGGALASPQEGSDCQGQTPAPSWRRRHVSGMAQAPVPAPAGEPRYEQTTIGSPAQTTTGFEDREIPEKIGSYLAYAGSTVCLAALFIVVLLFLDVGSVLAAKWNLAKYLICGGVSAEFLVCLVGFGAGRFIREGSQTASVLAIIAGAILVPLSFLIIGGVFGAFGGGLILSGGIIGLFG